MKITNKPYPYYEHEEINNLLELLELNKKRNPNNISFSYRNGMDIKNKTFSDVYDDVLYLSNYFNNYYKNEHIGLIGENSYNWIITFLSIVLSGNVCVVFDKDCDEKKLEELLKYSDTKTIYYSNKYCSFVGDMKYKTFTLEDINSFIEEGKSLENKYKIDNCSDACIFFTSGTTGPSKGVVLSQKNIASNIYGASSLFKPDGSVLSVLPFHHAFGLITSVLKPFYYGKEVFINNSLKYITRDLSLVKPNTLFLVPLFVETFYKQIWQTAKKKKKDKKLKNAIKISNCLLKVGIDLRDKLFKDVRDVFGGNLKYIICGGAYLDKKYVKWFRSVGIEILNGYGITECSPVVSVNRNNYYRDGSIGVACLFEEVKIMDGEICVKGPNVMKGYYKDKKSTSSVLIDGYFHTGDLGYIDEDGFIFLTGRKKNIIILSNGENVSPEEIESVLLKDEGVCEVIVHEMGDKIIASIYPEEEYFDNQEYFDDLIYKYNKNKPKNHQIAFVNLRKTEFIKNSNKKIIRSKALEENN